MKVRDLDLSDNRVNAEHRAIGLLLMELLVLSKLLRTVAPRCGAPRHVAKLGLMGTVITAVSAFNPIVALR
jgi:hypothetical protein